MRSKEREDEYTLTKTVNNEPKGCAHGGGCSSGGCNRLNTFDWLADIPVLDNSSNIVEVSFKNGARKDFYSNVHHLDLYKGQQVTVEGMSGFDVGEVSLKGALVTLQLKRKKVKKEKKDFPKILRHSTSKDIDLLEKARQREASTMIKARVIARNLQLEMKIGDVEFQADNKKATFYYIADGRVDFRELIKKLIAEFGIKVEMRQIGARQEAGKIGGIGSCGRELCCSTWLNEFKSVNTGAARYQNLSINTDKLSGQCGRLKCCLNYELDTYVDALSHIPKRVDKLQTSEGVIFLRKTDIFKKYMWYSYKDSNTWLKLHVKDVEQIKQRCKNGDLKIDINTYVLNEIEPQQALQKKDELVGQINLQSLDKKNRRKSKRTNRRKNVRKR